MWCWGAGGREGLDFGFRDLEGTLNWALGFFAVSPLHIGEGWSSHSDLAEGGTAWLI